MLTIDGSMGEGGGQILRSSLSLSLCLGRPFRIFNIRSARKRPGLLPQHLAAVKAAAEVGRAELAGAALGSAELRFAPERVVAGDYRFAIGTAGSTTLLLQTVLPALLTATGPSHLILEGGTHNPLAPPFDFLQQAFLPLIGRMGPQLTASLERPGFYPAGGGVIHVHVVPAPRLRPLHLLERGAIRELRASALVANLPEHIAQRELHVIAAALGVSGDGLSICKVPSAKGAGNAVTVVVASQQITEVFVGFGQRGVRAEAVAERVVQEVRRYLVAGVPVGEHLADQLLVPLALAGGGSYRTLTPSRHTLTNIDVVQAFTDRRIGYDQIGPDVWEITVR